MEIPKHEKVNNSVYLFLKEFLTLINNYRNFFEILLNICNCVENFDINFLNNYSIYKIKCFIENNKTIIKSFIKTSQHNFIDFIQQFETEFFVPNTLFSNNINNENFMPSNLETLKSEHIIEECENAKNGNFDLINNIIINKELTIENILENKNQNFEYIFKKKFMIEKIDSIIFNNENLLNNISNQVISGENIKKNDNFRQKLAKNFINNSVFTNSKKIKNSQILKEKSTTAIYNNISPKKELIDVKTPINKINSNLINKKCLEYKNIKFEIKLREKDKNCYEKVYRCLDCNKEYSSYKSLYSHINQKHIEHKYVCDWKDCKFSTPLNCRLVSHKKRHLKLKLYNCVWPGCNSRFVENFELNQHYYSRHNDSKHFCSQCDHSCKTKHSLKQHILVAHSEYRPFVCGECEKKYCTKSLLSQHKRRVHKIYILNKKYDFVTQ